MAQVGVIGLGSMGAGMAASLCRGGFTPCVFDVRPEAVQQLAQLGAKACASAAELAAQCDVVFSVVVTAAQTDAWLWGSAAAANAGAADHLQTGSTLVMCSTVSPAWSVATSTHP
jgi:L-threonate 2-dehydrogenase